MAAILVGAGPTNRHAGGVNRLRAPNRGTHSAMRPHARDTRRDLRVRTTRRRHGRIMRRPVLQLLEHRRRSRRLKASVKARRVRHVRVSAVRRLAARSNATVYSRRSLRDTMRHAPGDNASDVRRRTSSRICLKCARVQSWCFLVERRPRALLAEQLTASPPRGRLTKSSLVEVTPKPAYKQYCLNCNG